MPIPLLTYTVNGTTTKAHPLTQGLGNVSLITELEDGQQFFRTKWQGEIRFVGDDFKLFWDLAKQTCCQQVFVSLYRSCSGATPWKGVFNLSDLKFDVDACMATLPNPPKPDDGYQTLLENWSKTVNWLKTEPVQTIYSANKQALYRRARRLTHVLANLVSQSLADTSAASIIPDAGSPTLSVFLTATTNPVTRRANTWKNALCIQASEVAAPGDPKAPAPTYGFARVAELTLKEVVEDLIELTCLYPFLDPDTGKLRWEHISYFPALTYDSPTQGLSLPDTDPVWDGNRTVKTNTEALYGLYRLTIEPNVAIGTNHTIDLLGTNIFATTPDFGVSTIEFTDACVARLPGEQPLAKERTVKRIATDIGGAQAWDDTIDKANWLFIVENPTPDGGGVPVIASGLTEMANGYFENGNFSATSLVRDFHRHNQPFSAGVMNKHTALLPKGYRRGMKSVAHVRTIGTITIPYCCTDNPISITETIETWLGADGHLVKATLDVAAELLTLEISHPGPCQVPKVDLPFDPDENPSTCPPAGEFIREVYEYQYFPGQSAATGAQPCAVNWGNYYTDGKCGEYSTNDVISNGC
ncbi:hypothetical protein [Spirosoma sp.]|uniref:hypothetical protein n=1 Tax=Spirosoma sp. TaxID=1899569 RepID=UPI0026029832|nr:hypothetical protein [Spirosoma sp.]MCX6218335.1 hypothetical protein [Spirosoma sp.]